MLSISILLIAALFLLNVNISHQQSGCSYASNFDSDGPALSAASLVFSLNECCLSCQVNQLCQAWTYVCLQGFNQGYCVLKTSLGNLSPCNGSKNKKTI